MAAEQQRKISPGTNFPTTTLPLHYDCPHFNQGFQVHLDPICVSSVSSSITAERSLTSTTSFELLAGSLSLELAMALHGLSYWRDTLCRAV